MERHFCEIFQYSLIECQNAYSPNEKKTKKSPKNPENPFQKGTEKKTQTNKKENKTQNKTKKPNKRTIKNQNQTLQIISAELGKTPALKCEECVKSNCLAWKGK